MGLDYLSILTYVHCCLRVTCDLDIQSGALECSGTQRSDRSRRIESRQISCDYSAVPPSPLVPFPSRQLRLPPKSGLVHWEVWFASSHYFVSTLADHQINKKDCQIKNRNVMKVTFFSSPLLLLQLLRLSVPVSAEDDSVAYQLGYGDECFEGKCPVEMFCGVDSNCHERTCENMYLYAPDSVTGRDGQDDPSDTADMECYIDEFPDDLQPPCKDFGGLFPVAVHFSCFEFYGIHSFSRACHERDDIGVEDSSTFTRGRYATMNRVCIAKPQKGLRFVCYDMAPDTNLTSHFSDYIEAVETFDGCEAYNETWVSYGHFVESFVQSNNSVDGTFSPFPVPTSVDYVLSVFDPTLVAATAIQTQLVADLTGPDSTSPDSTIPVEDVTSSAEVVDISNFWLSIGFLMMELSCVILWY